MHLRHLSKDTLKHMIKNNVVTGLDVFNAPLNNCESCAKAIVSNASHQSRSKFRAHKAGLLLHIDTDGPMSIVSLAFVNYFILCKCELNDYRQAVVLVLFILCLQ